MVAGWGETGFMVNDAPTNPLKQVTVPIVSIEECRDKLSTVLTNVDVYLDQTGGEICAGGQSMRDACTVSTGDTGLDPKQTKCDIVARWRGTSDMHRHKWKI